MPSIFQQCSKIGVKETECEGIADKNIPGKYITRVSTTWERVQITENRHAIRSKAFIFKLKTFRKLFSVYFERHVYISTTLSIFSFLLLFRQFFVYLFVIAKLKMNLTNWSQIKFLFAIETEFMLVVPIAVSMNNNVNQYCCLGNYLEWHLSIWPIRTNEHSTNAAPFW